VKEMADVGYGSRYLTIFFAGAEPTDEMDAVQGMRARYRARRTYHRISRVPGSDHRNAHKRPQRGASHSGPPSLGAPPGQSMAARSSPGSKPGEISFRDLRCR